MPVPYPPVVQSQHIQHPLMSMSPMSSRSEPRLDEQWSSSSPSTPTTPPGSMFRPSGQSSRNQGGHAQQLQSPFASPPLPSHAISFPQHQNDYIHPSHAYHGQPSGGTHRLSFSMGGISLHNQYARQTVNQHADHMNPSAVFGANGTNETVYRSMGGPSYAATYYNSTRYYEGKVCDGFGTQSTEGGPLPEVTWCYFLTPCCFSRCCQSVLSQPSPDLLRPTMITTSFISGSQIRNSFLTTKSHIPGTPFYSSIPAILQICVLLPPHSRTYSYFPSISAFPISAFFSLVNRDHLVRFRHGQSNRDTHFLQNPTLISAQTRRYNPTKTIPVPYFETKSAQPTPSHVHISDGFSFRASPRWTWPSSSLTPPAVVR
jgi:hypothetical protein